MGKSIDKEVFKTQFGDDMIEFYVCDTNDLHPYREIKEIGIVAFLNGEQIDGGLEYDELVEFIKYLNKAKRNIKKFNDNSKPNLDIE